MGEEIAAVESSAEAPTGNEMAEGRREGRDEIDGVMGWDDKI